MPVPPSQWIRLELTSRNELPSAGRRYLAAGPWRRRRQRLGNGIWRQPRTQGVKGAGCLGGKGGDRMRCGNRINEQAELGMREPAGADQDGRRQCPPQPQACPPRSQTAGQLACMTDRGRSRCPALVGQEQAHLVAQAQALHHLGRAIGMRLQPALDLDPARHVELVVDVGLEVGLAHGPAHAHLTTRKAGRSPLSATSPATARRRAARARASRDMSVPMGRPRISAASL